LQRHSLNDLPSELARPWLHPAVPPPSGQPSLLLLCLQEVFLFLLRRDMAADNTAGVRHSQVFKSNMPAWPSWPLLRVFMSLYMRHSSFDSGSASVTGGGGRRRPHPTAVTEADTEADSARLHYHRGWAIIVNHSVARSVQVL
jgi:hypothetical protein